MSTEGPDWCPSGPVIGPFTGPDPQVLAFYTRMLAIHPDLHPDPCTVLPLFDTTSVPSSARDEKQVMTKLDQELSDAPTFLDPLPDTERSPDNGVIIKDSEVPEHSTSSGDALESRELSMAEHRLRSCAKACSIVLNARRTCWDTGGGQLRVHPRSKSPCISQIMIADRGYTHDRTRKRLLMELTTKKTFAQLAEALYHRAYQASSGVDRMQTFDVRAIAKREAYRKVEVHARLSDPTAMTPLCAGGLARVLYKSVRNGALDWIRRLHVITSKRSGVAAVALPQPLGHLADLLAERATLYNTNADTLSSDVLASLSNELIDDDLKTMRNAQDEPWDGTDRWNVARREVLTVKRDVEALLRLADASGASVPIALREGRASIERIARNPPPELTAAPQWRRCATTVLTAMVDRKGDEEVRGAIAMRWIAQHGRFASVACTTALERLASWHPMEQPFLRSVRLADSPLAASDTLLPTPSHVSLKHRYSIGAFEHGSAPRVRSGLTPQAEAAVRVVSIVWDLIGRHDEFGIGLVSAGDFSDTAMKCHVESGLFARIVHEEIAQRGLFIGRVLDLTATEVLDPDGQFATEVAEAMRETSDQTISELFAPLSLTERDGHARKFFNEMGRHMLPMLDAPPLERYASIVVDDSGMRPHNATFDECYVAKSLDAQFVHDAYVLVAEAIANLRGRVGIGVGGCTHPIAASLSTIPAVREWTSDKGPLVIDRSMQRTLPPGVRAWLLALASDRSNSLSLCQFHQRGQKLILPDPRALIDSISRYRERCPL